MKNLILIVAVLCSFVAFSQTNLIGTWNTGEANTKIEISESKNQITGNIKSSDNPKAENGKVILKYLKKDDNNWKGKIYAVKRQEWYDVIITPKENTLVLEIGIGFFSKILEWKKV